jgi:single-stranded-DNA-specific exonuclease
MFLVSLNRALRSKKWFNIKNINEPNLIDYLDLVSLGTVCDVVPLVGLNRAIVKQGLKTIRLKKNLGLKTLFDICKIESIPSIYHLGYLLGPRINAGGRVGKCSHGANLLLNKDPKSSFQLASELDQYNKERQLLEKDLLQSILNKTKVHLDDPVLILSGSNWHEGIIGIVAARLKDKFNKPVIIISLDGDIGKASARSIVGFDIAAIITAPISKPTIDLAEAFPISPSKEIIITGLLNLSFNLAATIPIIPSCQLDPLKIRTGSSK